MDNSVFDQRARADLGLGFSHDALNAVIRNAKANMQEGGDGVDGLLAAILKTQARANANYQAFPFQISGGNKLQILPNNDRRAALIVCISTIATTPVAGILLDQGPNSQLVASADDINRSIQINTAIQTIIDFNTAPTNFVTVVSCNNIAVRGVIFEGN